MLNDPPPDNNRPRRPHPLERSAAPPPGGGDDGDGGDGQPVRQRAQLHIPVVKPTVTQALIGINSVIFVIMYFVFDSFQLQDVFAWGASNRIEVLVQGEYHRLFTAMFMHGGLAHIVFNMYALWAIGQMVEGFFGHTRYLLVYFLGGVLGSIASVVFNGPNVVSVGASGAVFAVFGAQMVFLYNHRKLFGEMARQQLRQLIIIGAINFAFGIATTFSEEGVNIDNWGHLGGLVGGIIIAYLVGPVFLLQKREGTEVAFQAVDVNPLDSKIQQVFAYISALLIVLIVASFIARG